MLSDYRKKYASEYQIKIGNIKKLVPNLSNKTNYVVYYKNLQLHLPLGLKLTKIDRLLIFKQPDWMKICIDFKTEKSTNAANKLKKQF